MNTLRKLFANKIETKINHAANGSWTTKTVRTWYGREISFEVIVPFAREW